MNDNKDCLWNCTVVLLSKYTMAHMITKRFAETNTIWYAGYFHYYLFIYAFFIEGYKCFSVGALLSKPALI